MRLSRNLARDIPAVLLLCLTGWGIVEFPLSRVCLGVGLGLYALVLWWRPVLWLFFIPALLPVLDLSPWSGRFFLGAFDFVVWEAWAVLLLRTSQADSPKEKIPVFTLWIAGALIVSFSVSALVGLLPFQPMDANAFSNYYSRYNSLRVFKGFFYAWTLSPFLRWQMDSSAKGKKYFLVGTLAGLCGVGIIALWERQVFSGLLNFSSDFRITSSFFGMHVGGAYLEAYLAATLPVVAGCFCFLKDLRWRLFGGIALGLGLYAGLATFSRVCYFSFAVSAVILFVALFWIYTKRFKAFCVLGGALLLSSILAVPVLHGSYMQHRFSQSVQDAGVRFSHWKEALSMMDEGWGTRLFGMGLGSYPRTYFRWSSGKKRPSSYSYLVEGSNMFLRLTTGDPIYLGQKITLQPFKNYTLKLNLRSHDETAFLSIPVCEKSMLHSFDCRWLGQKIGNTNGQWEPFEQTFSSGTVGAGHHWYQKAPVELAFYNGGNGTILDIDNARLIDEVGNDLLRNGDFTKGNDYWFFTADNHLPWHIFNLWVHLLFESGWVGFLLFNLFIGTVVVRLVKGILRKDCLSAILLASIAGFLTVGVIGSLFDSPRISLLFFLISFIALLRPAGGVENYKNIN